MNGNTSPADHSAAAAEHQLLDVAVVVCSIGRFQLLNQAVRSVLCGDLVPAEIVIIDQSRNTGFEIPDPEESGHVRIRHIPSSERGVSRARNAGVRATGCEIVAFIDDDVIVAAGWLRALTAALRSSGPNAVVTGMVASGPVADGGRFAPSLTAESQNRIYDETTDRDVLATGNMALFRSAFDRVGYFDERLGPGTAFPAAEDNDFGLRLLRAGFTIHYEAAAAVEHVRWRKSLGVPAVYWRYGCGQGAFYAKHIRRQDRTMWKRLRRDLRRSLTGKLWRARDLMRLFFAAGVVAGCARWLLAEPAVGSERLDQ